MFPYVLNCPSKKSIHFWKAIHQPIKQQYLKLCCFSVHTTMIIVKGNRNAGSGWAWWPHNCSNFLIYKFIWLYMHDFLCSYYTINWIFISDPGVRWSDFRLKPMVKAIEEIQTVIPQYFFKVLYYKIGFENWNVLI